MSTVEEECGVGTGLSLSILFFRLSLMQLTIVFKGNTTDSAEYVTLHEVVRIGTEAVNYIWMLLVGTILNATISIPWSSHMLIWGIFALALAKGSVVYHRT